METRPPEKRLRIAPFVVQVTCGVIRDQRVRRRAMAILLGLVLLMVATGILALGPWLDPREHPARFLLFWLACGWVTLTAFLLALLDLLLMRALERRERDALREETRAGIKPPEQ